MTRRPLVLAAIVAGIALGGIATAIATGDDRSPKATAAATATATPGPVRMGPPQRPAGRLADGRYSGGYIHAIVERGSLRLAPRAADPAGGPGWAVRTFAAERRSIRGDQRTLAHPLYRQRVRCAELMRTYRGHAGWLFADRRFQATTAGAPTLLGDCTSRARPAPIVRLATVVAFPDPSAPVVERAAVYGLAPPGTRAATLSGDGADRPLEIAPGGGFLALLDGDVSEDRLAVAFTLGDGTTRRVPLRPRAEESRLPPGFRGPKPLTPIAGSARAEARAPDPAGGPGWAMPVADTKEGPTCAGQPGQVVGDRIGWVDTAYGLFTTAPSSRLQCTDQRDAMTDKRPCLVGYGGGGLDDPLQEDPLLRRARTERRISGARFQITATCRADVDGVTIRTPRDLRTLVPSARGHVVFALYDGGFPAGDIVFSAHLRDGATRSEHLDASF